MNYLGVHDSIRWCDTQAESPATQGDSKPFGHGPDVAGACQNKGGLYQLIIALSDNAFFKSYGLNPV